MEQVKQDELPTEIRATMDSHTELKQALRQSQMPVRFQAMVLGLTTLHQIKEQNRSPNPLG